MVVDLAFVGDGTHIPIKTPLLYEQDFVNYKGTGTGHGLCMCLWECVCLCLCGPCDGIVCVVGLV